MTQPITPFCKKFLVSQGIGTMEGQQRKSRPVPMEREHELVPVVPCYERGDIGGDT